MRIRIFPAVLLCSVALSACMTQPPAQVVMKGNNFYGTPEGKPVQMAAARSAPVKTVAPLRAVSQPEAAVPVQPVQSVELAVVEPRPSYGYQPEQSQVLPSRERAGLAQVSVRELEPLTASTAAPAAPAAVTAEEQVVAAADNMGAVAGSASEAPVAVEQIAAAETVVANAPQAEAKKLEVLPEPQARVVAETRSDAATSSAAATAKGFIWPVKGKIISQFGPKADGAYNDGINIAALEGEPIVAAADGEVVYSGDELRGYGNMVILRHENGLMTAYAHADRILVSRGEKVRQGVTIATVGKSGGVETAQLHFGVRRFKEPVDPMNFLGKNNFAAR